MSRSRTDPVAGALRAYLTVSDGAGVEDDPPCSSSSSSPSRSVSIHTSARANAVVRTLRIPWCDGRLEWKLLQDLAAPFPPEDAFDVVFDDPDFAPPPPPLEFPPEDVNRAAATTTTEQRRAVALVASLLHQYRARQLELLAACPDERVQLELALLQPLLEQEETEQSTRPRVGGPNPPPRLQLRLVPGARRNLPARACFSVPLVGVKRACLGPLLGYLVGSGAGENGDNNNNDDASENADADIRGLALVASFDVASSSSSTIQTQNLRLSLSAPSCLRRAGLPPMLLPPIGSSPSARPPLADYSAEVATRLAAHLKAQAPRAAARYALIDALAAVFGAAPLEVVVASGGDSALATPPPGADGGGGGGASSGGWSAVVARGRPAAQPSSSAALSALFPLLLDAQPLLLAVEISPRFPDEQPLLRVTRALGPIGGGGGAAATAAGGKRKNNSPAIELAEAGEAVVSGYPWSPRWPPEEQAARIYNHLASALAS